MEIFFQFEVELCLPCPNDIISFTNQVCYDRAMPVDVKWKQQFFVSSRQSNCMLKIMFENRVFCEKQMVNIQCQSNYTSKFQQIFTYATVPE